MTSCLKTKDIITDLMDLKEEVVVEEGLRGHEVVEADAGTADVAHVESQLDHGGSVAVGVVQPLEPVQAFQDHSGNRTSDDGDRQRDNQCQELVHRLPMSRDGGNRDTVVVRSIAHGWIEVSQSEK